ncbi:MAG: hypothetical protein R2706_05455 [Acidimicrobiales bacterium]
MQSHTHRVPGTAVYMFKDAVQRHRLFVQSEAQQGAAPDHNSRVG